MLQILKLSALYFAIVFGAGFVLGVIRTLWIAPALGNRDAELLEMPVMIAVTVVAAKCIQRRANAFARAPAFVAVGITALALLLCAEVSLAVIMRGQSVREALFDKDPISGPAYYLCLALFAAMPWLLHFLRSCRCVAKE